MTRSVVVLGGSGKLGTALKSAFAPDHQVTTLCSHDLDATDAAAVQRVVARHQPDVVINCVAFLGIDPCERAPDRARYLNALYPGQLARLSRDAGFKLVHISTDAVFPDLLGDGGYVESTPAAPLNLYGATKLQGDELVQEQATDYLIARIGILFGQTRRTTQFVEKMLARIADGAEQLRIAADIESSPCFSSDVAASIRELVVEGATPGLYHVANSGRATLYDLMGGIVTELGLPIEVIPGSHRDFPAVGRKNLCTPLASEKRPALRSWQAALQDYCRRLRADPYWAQRLGLRAREPEPILPR